MKKYIFIIIAVLIIAVALGAYVIGNKTDTSRNIINNNDNANNGEANEKLTLLVNIPCSGHAGLIKYGLSQNEGIKSITFRAPNMFDIYYSPDKISKEKILGMEIFKDYPAKIIN